MTGVFPTRSFICRSLIVLFLIAAGSSAASAATFTVTKTGDSNDGACNGDCSLREAIAAANTSVSDDLVLFDPQVFRLDQSIVLTGGHLRIENNGSLRIAGPGASLLILLGTQAVPVIGVGTSAQATIDDLAITGGRVGSTNSEGAGVSNFGTLTLNRVVVRNNEGSSIGSAGGIRSLGELTLNECVITANSGTGILRVGGTVEINNSLVSDNSRTGFEHTGTSAVTINNSTFSNNRGGGIRFNSSGDARLTINNSTVTGNYGVLQGAGIYVSGMVVRLNNSTVAFNRGEATNGGGIKIENGSGSFSAANSIIAQNTGNSTPSDFEGTLNSLGYNLIGTTVFANITGNQTGNLLNTDPKLLPLAFTGGATPTHSLAPGSPGIDAGDPANSASADQRGLIRSIDGNNDASTRSDIGAVESGILVANLNDDGPGSLRRAIADATASAGNDEIRFSTVFDEPQTIALTGGELSINGGGMLFINGAGRDKLTISGSNQGRVFAIGSGAVISNLRISGGRSASNAAGGGIVVFAAAKLRLSNAVVSGNNSRDGGGLFNSGGSVVIENTLIESNRATDGSGGAIGNTGGALTIEKSTLRGNEGSDGGAINSSGVLAIVDSTISGNVAINNGGGIRQTLGSLLIRRSLISSNRASLGGGGISSSANSLDLVSSTVSGNTAAGGAGGGILAVGGTTNLSNVTVAFNAASDQGGGVVTGQSATLNFRNTLVARNTAPTGPDINGTASSTGYNLFGNTSGLALTGATTGNLLNVDPLLRPLSDNGGPTHTHAIAGDSPAVDSGSLEKISHLDQRGYTRTADGNGDGLLLSDIGAFEIGTRISNVNNGGPGSLRQALADARLLVGVDEVQLADSFAGPQAIVLTGGELFANAADPVVIDGRGLLTVSGNNNSQVLITASFAIVTLNGVTIENGKVLNGDGGAISNSGTLTLSGSIIRGSTGNGGGGTPRGGAGIFNNTGRLILVNSAVRDNVLTNGDGGGILNNRGIVEIKDSSITGNSASGGEAGGLSNFLGIVSMTGSDVSSNTASRTGGILNLGTLTAENSTVASNVGQQLTGGIYNGGTLDMNNSTIAGNRGVTNGNGGGVFNQGTFRLSNSTVSGNLAGIGAGITNSGGTNNDRGFLFVLNSTLSGNRASARGGALVSAGGTVRLTNATVAFNSATVGNGGIQNLNGNVRARNSLIAQNTIGGSLTLSDFTGELISDGYNLIGSTVETVISGDVTGNLLDLNPLLDAVLRDNGGKTKTHALRGSSPAIDHAGIVSGVTSDQRSFPRPFDFASITNAVNGDGSDIGAFERQPGDSIVPEYAIVSGRVLAPSGQGLRNTRVVLTNSQGISLTATTSSFGLYSFGAVPTGESYILTVPSKRYRFAPRLVLAGDNIEGLDLVGLE